MKTIIRNFTSIFRKFVTANLLNLLGLSLAFASFFVIMTQVNYDLSYNKSGETGCCLTPCNRLWSLQRHHV